jgi:hypothetical protein
LQLITKNGYEPGPVEIIRLGTRNLSLALKTDKLVVKAGATVRVTWRAENYTKLVFGPGDIDVTNLLYYDFTPADDSDQRIELKGDGDFGQQLTDTVTLFVARISNTYTSNNGDSTAPLFYLNWSAYGIERMRLLPDNMFVRENETNHVIPSATVPVTYTLAGTTYDGEEVLTPLTLLPCSVSSSLSLERGMAIVGRMATLHWKAAHVRSIQLFFSDSPAPVNLPAGDTSYQFQVTHNMDKVKLVLWGDVNVIESEIPVPRFVGPEIRQLRTPTLSLQLGVAWMHSPLPQPARKTRQLFLLVETTGKKNAGLYRSCLAGISTLSSWGIQVSRGTATITGLRRKRIGTRVLAGFTVCQRLIGRLYKLLTIQIKHITNNHEQ